MSVFLPLLASLALIAQVPEPVFDVHLHALPVEAQGPPPVAICSPMTDFPAWDPQQPYPMAMMKMFKDPPCENPLVSPETDEDLMRRTAEVMKRRNVYGVLSGTPSRVDAWQAEAPGRFVRGLGFRTQEGAPSVEELREWVSSGRVEVLAEVTNQYLGIAPDDPAMEPYWQLAEELDLPVGIHIGPGPPGVIYLGSTGYRARLHSALTLEPVLVKHPRLRVYIMHAGFPMLDDLLALLYSHPQVHVGVGVIAFTQPRAVFHRYLRGIVEAGFSSRVMFGSDQMVWPEAIERSIEAIEEADFLSGEQKRAIFYENAARFFRFSDETRERHRQGR